MARLRLGRDTIKLPVVGEEGAGNSGPTFSAAQRKSAVGPDHGLFVISFAHMATASLPK